MKGLLKFCLVASTIVATTVQGSSTPAFSEFQVLQFYAQALQRGSLVIWKVQHDMDIQVYYLQHSMDQLEWEDIAEFSSDPLENIDAEDYYHAPLADGTHYYRLSIRRNNGDEVISKVIIFRLNAIVGGTDGPVTTAPIRPGRVGDNALPDQPHDGQVEVVNARGEVIINRPSGFGIEKEVKLLPAGTYYIRYIESGLIRKIEAL